MKFHSKSAVAFFYHFLTIEAFIDRIDPNYSIWIKNNFTHFYINRSNHQKKTQTNDFKKIRNTPFDMLRIQIVFFFFHLHYEDERRKKKKEIKQQRYVLLSSFRLA